MEGALRRKHLDNETASEGNQTNYCIQSVKLIIGSIKKQAKFYCNASVSGKLVIEKCLSPI